MLTHGAQNLDQIAGKATQIAPALPRILDRWRPKRHASGISISDGAANRQMPSDLNGNRRRDRKDANVDVLSRHRRSSIFLKETPVLTTTRVLPNRKEQTMRVMVIVKATKNSEAGVMPSEELLTEMGKFNEELVKAGVMLVGEGLHPSSKGKRVRFSGGKKSVIDGPFAATNELVAGFWLWQVKSIEDAVAWVRRCPDPMPGEDAEIEIRPVFEAEDFGEEFTPELRAQEERLRDQIDRQRAS
jgi:hypothetical protein